MLVMTAHDPAMSISGGSQHEDTIMQCLVDQSGDYLCAIHSNLADPDGGPVSFSIQVRTLGGEHCIVDA